ncbi:transmembrane protein 59-like isoform X1 [Leucoraja erinacea]|uniref:transmembrane protein 59-like isoform X1 n=1 Tax=Leucoraja erinaceus TaxID=7782 RepID=UPI0024575FFE|nr:transmembrane protein 59-like isoform X1 [Leucoraja erinacea]
MPVAVFPLQDTIACQRGCRLLSICQFVDGISGLNSTRAECEAACLEAYSQTDEQYGCTTGCREQFLEAERRQKQLLTSTSETPSFSLVHYLSNLCSDFVNSAQSFISSTWTFYLQADDGKVVVFQLLTSTSETPSFSLIHYVSNLCSDFVNSAQSFISSTWTFYLQADDGKVVVFQANPEVDFSSLDLEPSLPNETENPQDGIPGVQEQEEELPTPRTTPATLELQPAAAEGVRKESDSRAIAEPAVKEKLTDGEGSHTQHDFLACMSRRSGLPRWILAGCLVLSIAVMLWLSCASLVTAPDQHVKSQPLSISSDEESLVKSPLYGLSSVITVMIQDGEEEDDAGPLPMKVDLSKTLI